MGRGVRVRSLFLGASLGSAALATGATLWAMRSAPEHPLAAPLAVVLAFLVSVPLALLGASTLSRRLVSLRRAMAQEGDEGGTATVFSSPLRELDAVAAAAQRLTEENRRRIADLAAERDELARLVESAGEGIIQTAPDGRIVRMNRAARLMLALPVETRGQAITSLVRHPELRERFEAAAHGRLARPVEIAIDERQLRITTRPLGEPANGGRSGVVAIVVDLTELRRLEGVRRDFVANASHELKTPLTSIRGYTETLLTDDLPPELRRQFLETVHQNAERLQHIVEDLLDLSRLESGRWTPDLVDADPLLIAEEAWQALEGKRRERRIDFRIDAPASTIALADPVALRQIFSNLFDNAIRYTPDGGSVTVRIVRTPDAEGAPGRVAVAVSDTGVGIPHEGVARIFERFYRIDPARARAEGGTGLGLAIVKHLVESMGGDIAAESQLGHGTTIRFRLPEA